MSLDRDDIEEALQTAAYAGRKKAAYSSNVPVVAGEKAVRLLRMRLNAFLRQLPADMTVDELREMLTPPPAASDADDDES